MEKIKKNNNITYTDVEGIQFKDALPALPPPDPVTLIDDSDPQSLINLVHPNFRPKLLGIPKDMLELPIEDLVDRLKPTVTHYRLRYAFWNEFECAIDQNRMMKMVRVYSGICSEPYFSDKLTKNQLFLAFLVSRPTDYITVVKESLQAGMENLRKIVSANVFDENGELIPRAADVVIKGIALLDLRVKGAVIQRIDQRLVSLTVNKDIEARSGVQEEILPDSLVQLEQEIEKVKQQLLNAPLRGVRTTTDLVNYAERELNMSFSPEKKVVDIVPNPRSNANGQYMGKK